jgi:hypothetical protein
MQEKLPDFGTVLAILLLSDKTHLTNFSGGKKAYPCYLSLGNIAKSARSLGYMHAWPLVAYWPILTKKMLSKSGLVFQTVDEFSLLKRKLFHAGVKVVLDQLLKHATK